MLLDIHDADMLIVDRAAEVESGDVIVAQVGDEVCVKRLIIEDERLFLAPENDDYKLIEITEEMDFSVWAKVLHVIHTLKR